MDDILVHGKTQEEYDERLATVLNLLHDAGLTLSKVRFLKLDHFQNL